MIKDRLTEVFAFLLAIIIAGIAIIYIILRLPYLVFRYISDAYQEDRMHSDIEDFLDKQRSRAKDKANG
jgi:hypothetical protein